MRKWRCDCERYVGLKFRPLISQFGGRAVGTENCRAGALPAGPKKWQAEALALQESVIGTTIRAETRFALLRAP